MSEGYVALGIFILAIYLILGFLNLKYAPWMNHWRGTLPMIEYNNPTLALFMLFIAVTFWPLPDPVLLAIVWVMEKCGMK